MSPERDASHTLAQALARAAQVVARVLSGSSLNAALAQAPNVAPRLHAAAQGLAYEALRGYGRTDVLVARLAHRPLESRALYAVLLIGLAQLLAKSTPAHTLVDQSVEAATLLGQGRARGLVNAVLRGYLRREAELNAALQDDPSARYGLPSWWIARVKAAFPATWQTLLEQGNIHPPMTLRVNRRKTSLIAYQARLAEAGLEATLLESGALLLGRPCPVDRLPGFGDGEVSVQDAGAQRAAVLLEAQPGMRVLDACAAPGGKATHLLELCDCKLTAMDISAERTQRINENLTRLGLHAQVLVGDARHAEQVLAGCEFDRILLDAPCTASGVVRRHPDSRWLRRESDIERFAAAQGEMLESLWRLLAPDGTLLYATCSVFPEENGKQVIAFSERHPDARRLPVSGTDDGQVIPSATSDGFYYGLLNKRR